ncbi:DUF1515 domain-containing protein [Sinorhizobium medicae]|nr:DUF1515 domain-containing protein [Sinorhizobium medicae]
MSLQSGQARSKGSMAAVKEYVVEMKPIDEDVRK